MLGRVLVPALTEAGHETRVLSRQDRADCARGDLRTGEGLEAALEGVEVVVHAATSPFRKSRAVDVEGTRRLLDTAAAGGVEHVIYPSIVGVDRHPFPYYRRKWEAEQVVEAGHVPWTIARATQFHDLLDTGLRPVTRLPAVPVGRGFVFQPVDTAEYAAVLVGLVTAGPSGRVADTGGPEVRAFADLVRAWLRSRGKRRPIVSLPVPGRIGRAFRDGVHTCPDQAVGTVTWEDFLTVNYPRPHLGS